MDIVRDDNFENGLRLDIDDSTEAFNHPILNTEGIKKSGRYNIFDYGIVNEGLPYEIYYDNRDIPKDIKTNYISVISHFMSPETGGIYRILCSEFGEIVCTMNNLVGSYNNSWPIFYEGD